MKKILCLVFLILCHCMLIKSEVFPIPNTQIEIMNSFGSYQYTFDVQYTYQNHDLIDIYIINNIICTLFNRVIVANKGIVAFIRVFCWV